MKNNNTAVKEKEEKVQTVEEKAMAPSRREAYLYPFHLLQRDMNQLFEDFTRGMDMWRPRFADQFFGDFAIKVDLKDNDKEIVVTAEVPGVEQKDIEVLLNSETLTIKGEKKQEKEEKEKGYYRCERSYGSFQRMIPLPCEIEKDNVQATYANGVLKIVLAKSPEIIKGTKKVDIKST